MKNKLEKDLPIIDEEIITQKDIVANKEILDKEHIIIDIAPQIKKTTDERVHYGDSKLVTPIHYNAYNELSKNTAIKQKMEGFNERYCDIIDYILKITHEIWEERGVGVLYETYQENVQLHFGSHDIHGVNGVVASTLQTMHSFPDRRSIGENVIWAQDSDDTYFSSHRLFSSATNLGDSNFGPATGKKISYRIMADCKIYKNKIIEEWLVKDSLTIVKQLGYNPHEVAKEMAKNFKTKTPLLQSHFGLSENRKGQFIPEIKIISLHEADKTFDVGDFILSMFDEVWNSRYFSKIKNYYSHTAMVHSISNKTLVGESQIQGFLVSLFASFPNSKVTVERVTCNSLNEDKEAWDVSIRWRLSGTHDGIGLFGSPSGKAVDILGITQVKIRNEKIVEEWVLFDGLDVLRQIYSN